jgi:hypothetical protein
METTTTVDDSATPDNGLLARLRNNHIIPDFVVPRSAAEARANIAAAIDAARCGPAPDSYDTGDDDEELVEHVPVPAPVPARRQRKRSLASTLRSARKVGADRVIVDGVVIVLSPAAAVPVSDPNEWDEKYGHH